ncbi:aldose 1-epimerase family protein [Striga hermonthica]|uniref:Aldose 1-epimerase family protein n=1 Tax=Striga hermonthica TaxID=68872 RepID=A0A9N7RA00_STRHE|nr:aldose 1-epimerase family protein [Striga hermonthica]
MPLPLDAFSDANGHQRVTLSEPGGSSVEVIVQSGQVVSWKNNRREELLFVTSKSNVNRSQAPLFGGISISFPQATNFKPFEQHEYIKHKLWLLENEPLDRAPSGDSRLSSVNLLHRTSDKGSKILACRFEVRLNISISQGKLTLLPSVKNIGNKSFSFAFATRNSLSISDISEVRVEGLETLDYLDHTMHGKRFTEQADALTFDGEIISRTYLNTPSKVAIIDHERKRTFVVHKQGLPDCVVWNSGENKNDSKRMVSLDSAAIENPIVLTPFEVWRGFQEITTVSSSYCSGQLDPNQVVKGTLS